MKNLKYICLLVSVLAISHISTAQSRQEKQKARIEEIRQVVASRHFIFVAQYANPQGGGHRYLTSDYDFKVRPDSLTAFLPYFGQAYFDVPYNPSEGGIKFTSTHFELKAKESGKGSWNITITPHDAKYVHSIYMYITSGGSATLSFNITNKSPITFDGYIKEIKQ